MKIPKYALTLAIGWIILVTPWTRADVIANQLTLANIPEPSSLLLLGAGLVVLAMLLRRRIHV